MKYQFLIVLCVSTCALGAAEIYVGHGERLDIGIPANEARAQDARVVVAPGGALEKTGGGTWSVDTRHFVQNTDTSVTVRQGTLKITNGESPAPAAPARPDAVLSKAAFWVTTARNLAVTNAPDGTAYVTGWYDARESAPASTVYPWAKPAWGKFTDAKAGYARPDVPPTRDDDAFGFTGVFFGGYWSAKKMLFKSAASDTTLNFDTIANAFIVTGIDKTYGFTLGSNTGTPDFHIGTYVGPANTNSPYFHYIGSDALAIANNARVYLDGAEIDSVTRKPRRGVQLLETVTPFTRAHAGNFFSDRNINDRSGGDYIYEVVLFTNLLSEVERLQVQEYLLDTWNLRAPGAAGLQALLAPGATAELAVAADTEKTFSVAGAGTAVKTGPGTARVANSSGIPFTGALRVREGAAVFEQAAALDVPAGTRVDVSNALVTAAAAAPAAAVVKTGTGHARVTALAAGVRTLAVNAGTLTLAAPASAAAAPAPARVEAVIPNHSFEDAADEITSPRGRATFAIAGGATDTQHGWSAAETDTPWTVKNADRAVFFYHYAKFDQNPAHWPTGCPSPDGDVSLAIKGDCKVWTTVTVPRPGFYAFSLKASARYSHGYKSYDYTHCHNSFELLIGPDLDNLTPFAAFAQCAVNPYMPHCWRTPFLAAGNHVLMIRAFPADVDGCVTIDDLHLTRIENPDEPGVWRIPDGDFERSPSHFLLHYTNHNACVGWTFTPSDSHADIPYPSTGVAHAFASPRIAEAAPALFIPGERPYGDAALVVANQGGLASTTFKPPAGVWKLRVAARNWAGIWGDGSGSNTALPYIEPRSTAYVSAYVSVNGGAAQSLGTVTVPSTRKKFALDRFPNTFTVNEGDTVTLSLTQTQDKAVAVLDDLVLESPAADVELVANGSFNTSSSWSNGAGGNVNWQSAAEDWAVQHYGAGSRGSPGRVAITKLQRVVQNITFPEAGTYRLLASLKSRMPRDYGKNGSFGENPIRFWLGCGNVTNVIAWIRIKGDAWEDRAWLFDVAEPGTWQLNIQGMESEQDRTTLVDAVSVKRVADLPAATPALSKDLTIEVSDGALLDLDFTGTNEVHTVRLAGVSRVGELNAHTCPEHITGAGTLLVRAKSTVLIFR